MRALRRTGSLLLVAGILSIVGAATGATGASGASADPPGNNGTVKIDGVDFDSAPNNEPHVGCTFQVDFYGFDEKAGDAKVTFESQAPTADATITVVSGDLTPFIGGDAAGGGTDVDAQVTYKLAFTGDPQPNQGYHVKLTVNAPFSQGADTKFKVFFVTGCEPDKPTPTTATPTTATPTTATPTTATPTTATPTTATPTTATPTTQGAAVRGTSVVPSVPTTSAPPSTTAKAATPTSESQAVAVKGASVSNGNTSPAVANTGLARTGINSGLLAAIGFGLVLSGFVLVSRSRVLSQS